jgi:DNA invertase Pin-like site-specific DNA recombinase
MVDGLRNPSDMRQIFGKGIYKGRLKGTTKAEPDRARELRAKGLKVSEIAQAMGTSRRTVQRYLAG